VASPEKTDPFTITNAKVIGLLAAALIFVASYLFTSVVNSPHSRIDKLVEELEELGISDRLVIMELTVGHIRDDDMECKKRQEALVRRLNSLSSTVKEYQAATKEVDANQTKLIYDCMRRTQ